MNFVECHEEPIHIPGHIQSFGYLIGIHAESHSINFFSENIGILFNIGNSEDLFNKKISDFPQHFQSILESEIYLQVDRYLKREHEAYFDKITINGKKYHFSVFRQDDSIFLEFEEVLHNPHKYISNKYDSIYMIDNAQEIWDQLLSTLTKIVNYDRMMVYQFMNDGSGKVIAEKIKGDIESYLGLHYPEHDIPKQARALYLLKRKRIFSNVYENPVPLLSKTKEHVDLTYTASRSMSPIHGQYLKNTGAASSFSVSIIIDDKLWGLVTCQNSTPRHIDLEDRVQAGILTALASNAYSSFKSKKELEYRVQLGAKTTALKSKFLKHKTLFDSLLENIEEIRHLPEADGLAIVSKESIITAGATPELSVIEGIVSWATGSLSEEIYINNSFLKDYEDLLDINKKAAGVVIYNIEKEEREMLIWFRKEFDEHIRWAGKPEKNIELVSQNGEQKRMISPRTSFEVFKEDIKGNSKRWSSRDIMAIRAVRNIILETSHKQYNIIKELNDQLQKVNEELDSFSYTISHDLGTPLTVMKLNAQMLLSGLDNTEKNRNKLNAIIEEIDNMAEMMHDVLQLSRAKYSSIELESLATLRTIEKISENAMITYETPRSEIVIRECPDVLGDKTMLHQVFLNIINNAVKYSSQHESPKVEIWGTEEGDKIVYCISDNGIGIAEEDKHKMFKIFSRMDNAKKFKGNGVGLSIVHRIMKRIGGNVDYESDHNGTCFILTFRKP
ncbi:ATP-binding protein [Chryseobacterium sp. CT-SW4]|uniref:ATP-binding protein n=1 Tax=Chryseobacterium sp. SW-1 TaxID=3157343 RepID=UPI003B01D5A2